MGWGVRPRRRGQALLESTMRASRPASEVMRLSAHNSHGDTTGIDLGMDAFGVSWEEAVVWK